MVVAEVVWTLLDPYSPELGILKPGYACDTIGVTSPPCGDKKSIYHPQILRKSYTYSSEVAYLSYPVMLDDGYIQKGGRAMRCVKELKSSQTES